MDSRGPRLQFCSEMCLLCRHVEGKDLEPSPPPWDTFPTWSDRAMSPVSEPPTCSGVHGKAVAGVTSLAKVGGPLTVLSVLRMGSEMPSYKTN